MINDIVPIKKLEGIIDKAMTTKRSSFHVAKMVSNKPAIISEVPIIVPIAKENTVTII